MTIAIDGSRAFSQSKTGTENYSYQIIKNLAKVDTQSSYVVFIRPGVKIEDKWPSNFEFKSISFKRLWTQVGLAKQTFKDKIDVLFIPAHTLPIIRRPGLKTVVTVHDLGSQYLPKTHQLKQRLYLSFMTKVQLKGTTHLIAVSQATKDDLVKKIGLDPKKITVIYEGYDENLFQPVKSDLLVSILKHYDLEKGRYFLFVGTVQPRKNLERLITAFSLQLSAIRQSTKKSDDRRLTTDDLKLVIVGKKGWMVDEIYKLPAKLEIERLVKFLDYVPNKDLPALYNGAIALTFPSLFEGFGLPIIEAQACGCPVLTSNVSSMPEVVGHSGAIFVDPYDIDDIVLGMRRIKNKELRIKLQKAGFENIKRFSWEKAADQTLKVFEELRIKN